MNKTFIKIIFGLVLLSVVLLIINTLFYHFTENSVQPDDFEYPLTIIYAFFCFLSVCIFSALKFVYGKNKEQLGFAFLFLTGAKMALSYLLARPMLSDNATGGAEKVNFFIIFIVYLAIEAYYTARLLNNKQ